MYRVGFLGFTLGNPNKGCEALTYSFLYTLQRLFGKEIAVRYYATTKVFGEVKKYFPDIEFSYYQMSRKNVLLDLKKDFERNCDVIYDITFGDGFSDIYNPKSNKFYNHVKILAGKSNVPFVLLPQTYGPFENKFLEKQAAHAIKLADSVMSRDNLSTEYVKKISGREALTVTDLAFALPYEKTSSNGDKIKLGLNVSGLLWKGGFYKENQFGLTVDYQEYITKLIEKYLKDDNYEIHLIGHVIESETQKVDGDLFANDLLAEKYNGVIKAPAFKDPVETKNYIADMDVLVAARMHATVDAFSSKVPVVPFAYSRKFEGLYGSLGYNYIVDGCALSTDEALKQTIKMINNREKLKSDLKKCIKKIEDKNELFYNEIKKFER